MPLSCIISLEIMQRLQNFLAAEFPVTPAFLFFFFFSTKVTKLRA